MKEDYSKISFEKLKEEKKPPKKPQTDTAICLALAASLALGTTLGACAEKKDSTPLDPNQIKEETIKTQKEKKSEINNMILAHLSEQETQKDGLQLANNSPKQVDEKVVNKIIEIVEKERIEKEPKNRSSLAITVLGNITIERLIVAVEKEKIKEYIQIKNNIVFSLANILKEENKKIETQKEILYKNEIRKAIYQAFNRISLNTEIRENDRNILEQFEKHTDQSLSNWAINKASSYNIYKSIEK